MEEEKKARGIYGDPQNLQYLAPGLESDILIGGDLFVRLGNFDLYNTAKEKGRR